MTAHGAAGAAHSTTMYRSRSVIDRLYLDLETTGLDSELDHIVEVGVIGVTADLEPLFEVETLVAPPPEAFSRITGNTVVTRMMTTNGLLDDLTTVFAAPLLGSVERDLLALIDRFSPTPDHKIVLSGSGVGTFDHRFIHRHMPTLAARTKYWVADVGQSRREWQQSTGDLLVGMNDAKTHRAFDDVLIHLTEARAFRTLFQRLAAAAGGGDIESMNRWLDQQQQQQQQQAA